MVALSFEFAAVEVDAVCGVDPVAVLLDQPVDAIVASAFFVRGEGQNQIAIRYQVFLFQANEIGHQDGVSGFHVIGTAPVEITLFFDELEGIGGPVFSAGFDDIEMADEENWLALSGAVDASNQIFLAVDRSRDKHVVAGEACIMETDSHCFSGGCNVADRVGGVDFDELLEYVVRDQICCRASLGVTEALRLPALPCTRRRPQISSFGISL